jgi:hypothetical protein
MTNLVQDHPSVKPKEWLLSAKDRCDSCAAEALVKVTGLTGDIMFCGHHYNKIIDNPETYTKMMSFMLTIVDERQKLIKNKKIDSEVSNDN